MKFQGLLNHGYHTRAHGTNKNCIDILKLRVSNFEHFIFGCVSRITHLLYMIYISYNILQPKRRSLVNIVHKAYAYYIINFTIMVRYTSLCQTIYLSGKNVQTNNGFTIENTLISGTVLVA